MAIKTFTAGSVLTTADTNTYLANSGLVYVASGSLTQVTNSFIGCFSSTFDSYRVVISNMNNSTSTTRFVNMRFRTSSDDTTAVYTHMQYFGYGTGGIGNSASNGTQQIQFCAIANYANAGGSIVMDIFSPYQACVTSVSYQSTTYQQDVGAYVMRVGGGAMNTVTQYTGFSIIGTTDNLSGNVTIYGYRKA